MSTRYHHGDLRSALLTAAEDALEEGGAGALSLRELARQVGVSHAAPAHHFGSRRGLLEAVAARGFDELADRLEAVIGDDPRAGSRVYVACALARPQRYKLMFASGFLGGECTTVLSQASSRAYRALLADTRGTDTIDEESYVVGVPEFRRWSLLHGAVMLVIDGAITLERAALDALVEASITLEP